MKTKKATAKQINLFDWVNPNPVDRHPLQRSFQPEMRLGAAAHAGEFVGMALANLGIKLARNMHEEQLMEQLMERNDWDQVELENWMEDNKRMLSRHETNSDSYSDLEWLVLTVEEKDEENPF